jgi:hypothetical protein
MEIEEFAVPMSGNSFVLSYFRTVSVLIAFIGFAGRTPK